MAWALVLLLAAAVGAALGGFAMFMWLMTRDGNSVTRSFDRMVELVTEITEEELEENRLMYRAGLFSSEVSMDRVMRIGDRGERLVDGLDQHRKRLLNTLVAVPERKQQP